jgi:hypothetical protein
LQPRGCDFAARSHWAGVRRRGRTDGVLPTHHKITGRFLPRAAGMSGPPSFASQPYRAADHVTVPVRACGRDKPSSFPVRGQWSNAAIPFPSSVKWSAPRHLCTAPASSAERGQILRVFQIVTNWLRKVAFRASCAVRALRWRHNHSYPSIAQLIALSVNL